jgi:predicted nucleic acid-binding protein
MVERRYWDACTFLGWFNEEADKVDKCESVLKFAEIKKIHIITSALTLTEVVWLKGCPRLTDASEDMIRSFFENDFIFVRTVDRVIAEDARQLIWKHNVKPKDAIHLSTALQLKMTIFDTFDSDLIGLNEKLGNPLLRIGEPNVPYQEEMKLAKEKGQDKEDE